MLTSWADVRKQIRRDDAGKHDIIVNPLKVSWLEHNGEFMLLVNGDGPLHLSSWAESQLCAHLGIPVKYFRNCPAELKKMQVKYLMKYQRLFNKGMRVRLKGDTVRAFVSTAYQPFDNHDIAKTWENLGRCNLFEYEALIDDTSFYLRALQPGKKAEDDNLGGLLNGLYIRNSEVGRSGIYAGPIVYRLICSNGLVAPVERKPLMYRRHIWNDEVALIEKLELAIEGSLDISIRTRKMMAGARRVRIDSNGLMAMLDAIEIEEHLKQQALDEFTNGGEPNMFGAVNALTAAARELPPHERYILERDAGEMLARMA